MKFCVGDIYKNCRPSVGVVKISPITYSS